MAEKNRALKISFNAAKRAGRKRAAKKTVSLIKAAIQKNFRIAPENVRLSAEVNQRLWQNGSFKIPSKLEFEILQEKETGWVFLKDGKEKERFLEKKKTKEKPKKEEKKEEKKETKEEQEKAEEEKKEQEKKLEEKRLKENMAEKAGFK